MNKKAQRVLSMLKPKVKALGFDQREIKGLAVKMAEKLKSDDEASEEELDEEINTLIDEALPLLQFAQATASRQVSAIKKQYETDDDDDDDDDDDVSGSHNKPGSKKSPTKKDEGTEPPAWAKSLIESNKQLAEANKALQGEIAAIKNGKTADTRRATLDAMLKDAGVFGKTIIKQFEKMNFEDDADFETFRKGVEDDLAALNQERADAGLGKLGTPPNANPNKDDEVEVLSDDDIKAMASM